ncbi:titin [Drosophila serrata]|uniref:titin n=1 Tax=Drosophila serrata TaxID=7274 RepID=UPI000A1D2BE9|nr:titin [Drosophila serrata]
MWKTVCVLILLSVLCSAGPLSSHQKRKTPMVREEPVPAEVEMPEQPEAEVETAPSQEAASLGTLTLPSNATSIRADITDNFSCSNKTYGYYADVENDCQIFHVCLPVTYADGRENTFRWSFICPEDTIFSQESFTCMRREDMTIECADSSRYYELNGNFGGAVEEEIKPTPEESEEPEKEVMDVKPVEAEPEVPAEPVVVETPKPAKPVKAQKPKPNRRKPQQPHRKTPVPVTAAPEVEAVPEPVAALEVEAKPPKPQRFTIRPNKEKPHAFRPAIAAPPPMRNELFNGIRKRPAIFNKPASTSTAKPVEEAEVVVVDSEPAVTEAVVQLSEPQPTLKLQTMFAEPAVIPVEVQEPEVQASEPALSFVQPETVPEVVAPTKIEIDTRIEEVKPIEAIEEIPAVIVESLDEKKPEEEEKESATQENVKAEEEFKPEEGTKVDHDVKSVEEIKPADEIKSEEIHQPEEEPEIPAQVEEIHEVKPEDIKADPAIIETSNSNEETHVSIEALEAAKPADAPESMPATPEMEQHSPLVEEILDSSSNNAEPVEGGETQESLGGFKPVDPVMAAEAEQLITDFLNTLKKNEEKPETDMAPIYNADVSIEEAKLPEPEIVDKNASVEEQILEESEQQKNQKHQMMKDSPIINIMQLNHLPMDYQIPVQVIPMDSEPVSEISEPSEVPEEMKAQETPEEVKEETPTEEIQEAVKEATPEEVTETISEAEKEITPEAEAKPEETPSHDDAQEESLVTASYMPSISIDDIVELVKERLDQTPKKDQMAPMELILTPGAAAPMTLVQSTPVQAVEQQPEPMPEQEELILPIYKRVSAAEPAMSKVQTLPVTGSKVETVPESQPEIREPKMDARKRRFLFRADAS